jgi:hypothetical protein
MIQPNTSVINSGANMAQENRAPLQSKVCTKIALLSQYCSFAEQTAFLASKFIDVAFAIRLALGSGQM